MKLHCQPFWQDYLDRSLSGKVFTWRQIISLLIPSILDSLSITLINMLTTALISKNGEASIAAVSLVGPITGLVVGFIQGLTDGSSIIVAQCFGKDKPWLLKRSVGMAIWMTPLVTALICLPLFLFPQGILYLLYPDAEVLVMEKACVYLAGSAWSLLLYALYSAMFRVLRGLGESKRCLILSVIINLAYFLFSVLFINMLHMDIYGSIFALLLARIVGTVSAAVALFGWNPPVRLKLRELFSYDASILRSTVKISVPFAFEKLCTSMGNLAFQVFMAPLGTTAIATHAIANSLFSVLQSPALSVGNLSVTIVGRCIGAGENEEAYRYGKRCNQIALFLLVLTSLIFYPLLPLLLRQYNPSAEAEAMARMLLFASIPFLLAFWPMSHTLPSTLRSGGDSLYPTVVSLSVLWLMNIGLGYVLAIQAGLGLWGIWIALWSGWAVQSGLIYGRFRSRKWMSKSMFKSTAKN